MTTETRVKIDWYEVRTGMIIAAMLGGVFMSFALIVGLARGLPWPPRWDDFTFAMVMLGVVVPGCWLARMIVRDFFVAWRKANEISAPTDADSPAGFVQAHPSERLSGPDRR